MLLTTLIAAVLLGAACAALSVLVVLRRWAFIGEGIAHAGFGGVGTAWLISLVLPWAGEGGATYAIAVAFCLVTALGIGRLTRRHVQADTAIGIFLVASLAWGFLAQAVYRQVNHADPPGWDTYLLGELRAISLPYAVAAGTMGLGVLAILAMLGKEIVAYCFDPAMAEVSGVRVGMIHYLLIALLTITIVLAMKLVGPLLVTALLVLPGAAALQLSRRLARVFAMALAAGVVACALGPLIHARWAFLPIGPAIALLLLLEFLGAYAVGAARR